MSEARQLAWSCFWALAVVYVAMLLLMALGAFGEFGALANMNSARSANVEQHSTGVLDGCEVLTQSGTASAKMGCKSCSGLSSNTPLSNRQTVYGGGEDTAVIGVYVRWSEFGALAAKLDAAKAAAQEGTESGSDFVRMPGVTCRVYPTGTRGGGGPMFRWLIETQGAMIAISNRDEPAGETPNVMVTIGSIELLQGGGLGPCWERIKEKIEGLGGEVQRDKLSRVDACVDVAGLPLAGLAEAFRQGHWVGRPQKAEIRSVQQPADENGEVIEFQQGLKCTGLRIGSGPMLVRIYDKLRETRHQAVKRQLMVLERWGGQVPRHAYRVEFQLRREKLKEFGVNSVADWLQHRASILNYLCSSWLRFTAGPVDRRHGNEDRAGIHAEWSQVHEAFLAWADAEVKPVERRRVRKLDMRALRMQAFGCFLGASAIKAELDDPAAFADFVLSEFAQYVDELGESEIKARIKRRRSEALVKYPWLKGD